MNITVKRLICFIMIFIIMISSGCIPSFLLTTEKDMNCFSFDSIPAYDGKPFIELNNGIPFNDFPMALKSGYEQYSELDDLGRCGVAIACLGPETMPTDTRTSIGMIKPSGWHTVNYHELIEGNYLYNRCHLIAFSLSGESANEKNLITGTRYMNVEGMLPIEIRISNYIQDTGNHVLYRSTPIFEGDHLVASGVVIEALSVEDDAIRMNVFCYNVQPGIEIDYETGDSHIKEETNNKTTPIIDKIDENETTEVTIPDNTAYVLNLNTRRFHLLTCDSVKEMKEKNRGFTEKDRETLIEEGFIPCGSCKP